MGNPGSRMCQVMHIGEVQYSYCPVALQGLVQEGARNEASTPKPMACLWKANPTMAIMADKLSPYFSEKISTSMHKHFTVAFLIL